MPKELDELQVEGESEIPVDDEVPVDDDDGNEADATQHAAPVSRQANPMDNMVPLERFNEINGELQTTRQLLNTLASRMPQTAPAAPRTTYVRPGEAEDVTKWRGFVGETVDPAVQAAKAELKGYVDNIAAQAGEAIDLQNVRGEFADYDKYAPQVDQLRANFVRQTGQPVQRRWAYLAVVGNEALQSRNGTAKRSQAIQRTTAAASTSSKAPAAGQRTRASMPKTRADVNAMTLKQMEDVLGDTPI